MRLADHKAKCGGCFVYRGGEVVCKKCKLFLQPDGCVTRTVTGRTDKEHKKHWEQRRKRK